MKKVVMGLSGGMDSTTLLAILLDDGYDVHCCSFTYGSKHNAYEGKAAENIIKYYKEQGLPVTHYQIDLTGLVGFRVNITVLTGTISAYGKVVG